VGSGQALWSKSALVGKHSGENRNHRGGEMTGIRKGTDEGGREKKKNARQGVAELRWAVGEHCGKNRPPALGGPCRKGCTRIQRARRTCTCSQAREGEGGGAHVGRKARQLFQDDVLLQKSLQEDQYDEWSLGRVMLALRALRAAGRRARASYRSSLLDAGASSPARRPAAIREATASYSARGVVRSSRACRVDLGTRGAECEARWLPGTEQSAS